MPGLVDRLTATFVALAFAIGIAASAYAEEDCHCGSSDQLVEPSLSLEFSDPAALTGQLGAHDPSTLVKDGNKYYYFSTGSSASNPILSRTSTNLSSWSAGATVFSTKPAWTTSAVPSATNFWAPEIKYFAGLYHLYYSVSSFGTQVSAIGLATSPTLNTAASNYAWTDQGAVIQSQQGSAYNTIDPSVFKDTDGSMYMTFGSFWNGIYQVQLNPSTGKRVSRLNPETGWIVKDVPDLRIVDGALWQAVRARQADIAETFAKVTEGVREHHRQNRLNGARRPRSLLSGLITCGCCEGPYALRGADRFACSNHVGKGTCDNSRTIPREALETQAVRLRDLNWLGDGALEALPPEGLEVAVRVRSTRAPVPGRMTLVDGEPGFAFDAPEEGVAPGQACVLYAAPDGRTVLGGGFIVKTVSAAG